MIDMQLTETQLRKIIRRGLMSEAWNDDITGYFTKLLDWLEEAYEEREKEAEAVASKITWKPDDEEKFKADAEAMGIDPEEAAKILEDPETAKAGDKNHAALLAAIYSSAEYNELLESVMKELQGAAGLVEDMSDEDEKKAKEASDKVMEHLGNSFGAASGIANSIKGDYAVAFKNFIDGAKKVSEAKELHVWAIGVGEFGTAADELAGMLDKAKSFVPEAELTNSVIDGSVWKKAGPAIKGEAEKLAGVLEKQAAEAQKAAEEGGGDEGGKPSQVSKGDKAEADGILISDKQAKALGVETKQESLMRNFLKELF